MEICVFFKYIYLSSSISYYFEENRTDIHHMGCSASAQLYEWPQAKQFEFHNIYLLM